MLWISRERASDHQAEDNISGLFLLFRPIFRDNCVTAGLVCLQVFRIPYGADMSIRHQPKY